MPKKQVEVDVQSQGVAQLAKDLSAAAKAAKEAAAALAEVKRGESQISEKTRDALRAGKTPPTSGGRRTKEAAPAPFGITPEEMADLKESGRRMPHQNRAALAEARAADKTARDEARASVRVRRLYDTVARNDDKRRLAEERAALRPSGTAAGRIFTAEEKRSMTLGAGPQTGPAQRLAHAQREMFRAEASDDPNRVFSAKVGLKRAQDSMRNAERQMQGYDLWNRAGQALAAMRIRLGAGGGGAGGGGMFGSVLVMPLLRNLGALGEAAGMAGGPVTAVAVGLGAAIIAIKTFTEELGQAGRTVRQLTEAQTLSGGTMGEISRLTSIGIAPGQIAPMGQAFRERLSRDPFAIYTAASLGGGYRMPRPFGDTNEAGDLMDVLDNLRQVKNAEDQLRMARMMGLETALDLIKVTDKVWQSMKRDAEVRSGIVDEDAVRSARDMAAEVNRVTDSFDNLRISALKSFFPEVSNAAGTMADMVNAMAGSMDASGNKNGFMGGMASGMRRAIFDAIPGIGPFMNNAMDMLGGTAMEENTRAIQDNTRVQADTAYLLRYGFSTPETSARTRRIIPDSMFNNPIGMRKWLEGQTAGSGAYRY